MLLTEITPGADAGGRGEAAPGALLRPSPPCFPCPWWPNLGLWTSILATIFCQFFWILLFFARVCLLQLALQQPRYGKVVFQYIRNNDPFVGRDAASPWMKPNTAKAEPWGYRSSGASAFTACRAGSYLAPKAGYYHAAEGEKVEDVGKLLAELRLGTTAVEM